MSTDSISKDPIARFAETQHWMPVDLEVAAQKAIQTPFREAGSTGESMLSLLHGEWLHQPLHAVLTDVPLGAWTVTVAADLIGSISGYKTMDQVADVALKVGLVGAAGAAVTGLADWSEIKQPAPRRIGAAHALLNIGATTMFALSCLARRKKHQRPLSRALAVAGYLTVALAAHLGGNLVYEHGIGVRPQSEGTAASPAQNQSDLAESGERPRDPEDRRVPPNDELAQREKNFDKTLADSFPTSDPPSTIPDPGGETEA